ncbi:DUF3298 and DUF4163 domain-containing protein [Sedimentibacter sp.]|uniref:DUF3298 and DUF4163 domain-containing protein n=1 Tax=Sedimentibacter sp. TaxID=1960295 RepID=UPI00289C6727|nr:DUF3298 and DUF4163 domain-containing protein [Sedimentibacter sp.]
MNKSKKAEIRMQNFEETFRYGNVDVMKLTIKYPVVKLQNNPDAQAMINNQIAIEVNEYHRHVSDFLYNQAVNDYREAQENNYPFHGYEAYMEYVITYNDNCFLSYYYDKYEYTGGAHGMTLRSSNTFELCRGTIIPLYCFFKKGLNYRRKLIFEIIKQADERLKEEPGIFFDDYESLIIKNFDEDNYFLSPDGLSIYYQHYDIAPYSTGIVVFTIPYKTIGWYPSC